MSLPLLIHRVLNTDNMSIVGVTIDYGPYGFIDQFESGYICNSSGLYFCAHSTVTENVLRITTYETIYRIIVYDSA